MYVKADLLQWVINLLIIRSLLMMHLHMQINLHSNLLNIFVHWLLF